MLGPGLAGVTVLVVGRVRLYREALATCLTRGRRIGVVGTSDAGAALAQTRAAAPDVVVVDLAREEDVPLVAPLAATGAGVVVVGGRRSVRACAGTAISGFVLKDDAPEHLVDAVETVAGGGTTFGPAVVSILRRAIADGVDQSTSLTTRELEVLRLVADGLSNKEIAIALSIERHTVKNHLSNAYRKLGATSRTDAVARLGPSSS
jgi:DNA-binding NarL/FixJ family response regulator